MTEAIEPDAPESTEPIHLFVCENCGTEANLTNTEAYDAGWDYPPFMGAWGIISPRTCGDCGIDTTLWWALMTGEAKDDSLTEKQRNTALRILNEKAR